MRPLFYSPILLILTACQTSSLFVSDKNRHDGPPTASEYHSKQKGAKAVIPKVEPRSRYGNPDSYDVLGKTYHVLPSAKAFKQEGLASWYGTKFHSKLTSSGEPYDMYELTAAHKTLPLPTYVKVKNQDNGKELVVKVNDRGPFHEGRIIDLSYAAAQALGVVKHGVAHVIIEAVALNNAVDPMFYLQVAAFHTQNSAEQFKDFVQSFLEKKQVSVEPKADGYIVIVGPFESQIARNHIIQKLEGRGVKGAFSFMR